ncbi:MAG: NAD(P)-binding domain-containing protein [Peptococcaceae bacterium]
MTKIAIVGCGRMGSLLAGKLAPVYELYVYDRIPDNAQRLSKSCGAVAASKEDLRNAEIIIMALATETVLQALRELEDYLAESAVIVNIATTLPHSALKIKYQKVSAKIIGHAKEMAAGEKPVVIVEGDNEDSEKPVRDIFAHIGTVEKGDTDLVGRINTLSSKYGILTALQIQKELEGLKLSQEIVTAAIRNVAAGTMKAFALGDAGPFAQSIIAEYDKEKNV